MNEKMSEPIIGEHSFKKPLFLGSDLKVKKAQKKINPEQISRLRIFFEANQVDLIPGDLIRSELDRWSTLEELHPMTRKQIKLQFDNFVIECRLRKSIGPNLEQATLTMCRV